MLVTASARYQEYDTSFGIVASASIEAMCGLQGSLKSSKMFRSGSMLVSLAACKNRPNIFYTAQIQGITSTCNNWGDIHEYCSHQRVIWRDCHWNWGLTTIKKLQALAISGIIKLASTRKYVFKEIGTNSTFPYSLPCNDMKVLETFCAPSAVCNYTTAPAPY